MRLRRGDTWFAGFLYRSQPMGTARRTSIAALALLLLVASDIAAQHRRHGLRDRGPDGRSGFWGVLTMGAGVEQVNFTGDGLGYSDAITRPAGSIRLGGTLSRNWRLGAEFGSWVNEDGPIMETVSGASLITQFYPGRRSGLFLKGGLGFGRSSVEDDFGSDVEDYGFVGTLGIGWDVRLGRHVFLVPSIDFANYEFNSGDPDRYRERVTTFGVGIAYQR